MERAKTDFYTFYHKGLRKRLFDGVVLAGTTDWTDPGQLTALERHVSTLMVELRMHTALEDEAIHPLFKARAPELLVGLENEHEAFEQKMTELEASTLRLRQNPSPQEALSLYRGLSCFLAAYLQHLDHEEVAMPILTARCSDEELQRALTDIRARQNFDLLSASFSMMLEALNADERAVLLHGVRKSATNAQYAYLEDLAQQTLAPADWAAVQHRLDTLAG